eukprot:9553791-Alexandrium_andersonii.AAC.1
MRKHADSLSRWCASNMRLHAILPFPLRRRCEGPVLAGASASLPAEASVRARCRAQQARHCWRSPSKNGARRGACACSGGRSSRGLRGSPRQQ